MRIGYIRVSTAEQNTARQEALMQELPADFESVIRKWQNGEITAVKTMKKLGVSKSTFYRLAKKK